MVEDVTLMKQYNINAIRTSHYSNDDYLYYLCNKYGLYMMGETNLESHQLMNNAGKQRLFKEMVMDRTVKRLPPAEERQRHRLLVRRQRELLFQRQQLRRRHVL